MRHAQTFSGRTAFALVILVFSVAGIGMGAGAIYQLRYGDEAVPLAALVTFSWALMSMVLSMLLVMLTNRRREKGALLFSRASGVDLNGPGPGNRLTLKGPGAEVSSAASTKITSRIPASFLYLSSFGLFIVGLVLFCRHRLDLTASGIFIAFCYFIASWATKAWPRA